MRRGRPLARSARQAFDEAVGPPAGPVHVNLPFREPLVPPASARDTAARDDAAATPDPAADGTRTNAPIGSWAVEQFADALAGTERGLILAGWLEPWTAADDLRAIAALAASTGWPLVAEPLSGLRRPPLALSAGQLLLHGRGVRRGPRARGRAAAGRGADHAGRPGDDRRGPGGSIVVSAGPADPRASGGSGRPLEPGSVRPGAASARCRHAAGRRRRGHPTGARPTRPCAPRSTACWTDSTRRSRAASRATWPRAAPDGSSLFAGSSMPVRDLDAYMAPRTGAPRGRQPRSERDRRVGVHRARHGRRLAGRASPPGVDRRSHAAPRRRRAAVVRARRRACRAGAEPTERAASRTSSSSCRTTAAAGSSTTSPVASEPEHERLFVTPHAISLEAIAVAAGAGYRRVEVPDELAPAATAAVRAGGVHLIEVPIDRAAGGRAREAVRAAVQHALRSVERRSRAG